MPTEFHTDPSSYSRAEVSATQVSEGAKTVARINLPDDGTDPGSETGVQNQRSRVYSINDYPIPSALPDDIEFKVVENWEGVVLERFRGSIIARLNSGYQDVRAWEAEMPLESLSPSEVELAEPGARFQWKIGYETRGALRNTISVLSFYRAPGWTATELDDARTAANQLRDLFESSHTSS